MWVYLTIDFILDKLLHLNILLFIFTSTWMLIVWIVPILRSILLRLSLFLSWCRISFELRSPNVMFCNQLIFENTANCSICWFLIAHNTYSVSRLLIFNRVWMLYSLSLRKLRLIFNLNSCQTIIGPLSLLINSNTWWFKIQWLYVFSWIIIVQFP